MRLSIVALVTFLLFSSSFALLEADNALHSPKAASETLDTVKSSMLGFKTLQRRERLYRAVKRNTHVGPVTRPSRNSNLEKVPGTICPSDLSVVIE